ncbi:MAG: DUF5668 domain-containing protein [Thermoanaerobaculia bacterium]|nr:DUF5668 domain-containing protein [Thermoanaerobaculia bacterium]
MTLRTRRRDGGLAVGLVLISLGVLLLLGQLGFVPLSRVLQFWPFVLIGLGFAKILRTPGEGDDRFGGFWLVIAGLYCLVSAWGLFGLHWGNSWPLMIIAGGAMTIVRTLAQNSRSPRSGDRHE